MPLITIQTSVDSIKNSENFLKEISSQLALILGKPEKYVMTSIQSGISMTHGGSTEPTCYIEIKSIGLSNNNDLKELSSILSQLIKKYIGVSSDRIYIEFKDVPGELWGWNGGTFG